MQLIPICFSVPIENSYSGQSNWQKAARASDWLLGVGKQVYKISDPQQMTLYVEDAKPSSKRDQFIKCLLIATVISALAALVIKILDRFVFGSYTQPKTSPKDLKIEHEVLQRLGALKEIPEISTSQEAAELKEKVEQTKKELYAIADSPTGEALIAFQHYNFTAFIRKMDAINASLARYHKTTERLPEIERIRKEAADLVSPQGNEQCKKNIKLKTLRGRYRVFYVAEGAQGKHLKIAYQDRFSKRSEEVEFIYQGKKILPEGSLSTIEGDITVRPIKK
jgi:hypothetical protein